MKGSIDAMNAGAFVLALALVAGSAYVDVGPAVAVTRSPAATIIDRVETLPDGKRGLRDAQGVLAPLREYRRIASATLVADRLLADLCEPERVIAYTRQASRTEHGHRYAGRAAIGPRDSLEHILSLAPDLLLVSELFDASYVTRLRERGVQVFDLGAMRGVETLVPAIHALGSLIGAPQRAAQYAETLTRRLRAVASDGRKPSHQRAIYVGVYGDRLFGGARHTSYHDVLTFAGLRDVAAEAGLEGWPELTSERLLALDPDVVVTRTGMGAIVCRAPGLENLQPCRGIGRLIELDATLLDDPGPAILDAAEALRAAVLAL